MAITQTTLLVMTGVAFTGSWTVATITDPQRVALRVLGGAFIVVLWGAVAFWWTEYDVILDLCDCTITKSNPAVSVMALIGGAVMLLDVMKTAFALIGSD